MRTQHNLDEVVAAHDRRSNGAHDVRTGFLPADSDKLDPLVQRAKILVHLSSSPRTSWPLVSRHWTPADRAERQEWVRKLYGDEGLAVKLVAEMLGDGVSAATVQSDVTVLGIQRGSMGKGNARQLQLEERREKVKALYSEGFNGPEIADKLGVACTTVTSDLRALDLSTAGRANTSDKQLAQVIGRALEQLAAMGRLVNDQDLGALAVDRDTAVEWERRCKIVTRAIGRVRRAMKGEP